MADKSPHLNNKNFAQGNNIPISTPIHTPEKEESRVLDKNLRLLMISFGQFNLLLVSLSRSLGLLHVVVILSHTLVKKETNPNDVLFRGRFGYCNL